MVQEAFIDEDTEKDPIINVAFKLVVRGWSAYCRSLGVGNRPMKVKYVTGLHDQLQNEYPKRESL